MDSFNDFYLLRSVVLSLSLWHTKTPHFLNSIPYCLTNGVQFSSGAGGDLLLRNDHTKGVGMAIDVFVDNGNSHVGGGEERFIHVSFDEAS